MSPVLTDAAQTFVRRLLRFDGGPGRGLRFNVTPHGCAGLTALFSVETAPAADEQILELDGVRLFVSAASLQRLEGVTIDFLDTPLQTGFVFHDPRKVTCSRAPTLPPLPVPVGGLVE
jgi:iron-sulfur cluster assembly accessory protein